MLKLVYPFITCLKETAKFYKNSGKNWSMSQSKIIKGINNIKNNMNELFIVYDYFF